MTGCDLVLAGGRIIDPGLNLDRIAPVGFSAGRVAALGEAAGARTIDVAGCLVVPGAIDFHAHVYWGGTSLGIDADSIARRAGTTTWVDTGSGVSPIALATCASTRGSTCAKVPTAPEIAQVATSRRAAISRSLARANSA